MEPNHELSNYEPIIIELNERIQSLPEHLGISIKEFNNKAKFDLGECDFRINIKDFTYLTMPHLINMVFAFPTIGVNWLLFGLGDPIVSNQALQSETPWSIIETKNLFIQRLEEDKEKFKSALLRMEARNEALLDALKALTNDEPIISEEQLEQLIDRLEEIGKNYPGKVN